MKEGVEFETLRKWDRLLRWKEDGSVIITVNHQEQWWTKDKTTGLYRLTQERWNNNH